MNEAVCRQKVRPRRGRDTCRTDYKQDSVLIMVAGALPWAIKTIFHFHIAIESQITMTNVIFSGDSIDILKAADNDVTSLFSFM